MSRLQTGAVIGAAISTLLLSLLDTNILTAAAPSIGRDFGGGAVAQVPWLIVAYALAETVAQPLYGRLADRHGPLPVLLAALAVFGLGSVLCASAGSMPELVALRVLQGLGAAGLLSVTFVLIAHLRPEENEGGGGNAAAAVMLAAGLVMGPLLGGTIVEHVGWRWIFWINVPVTAAVFAVIAICLRIETERSHEPIDWRAAALLAAAAAALQLVCLSIGPDPLLGGWALALVAVATPAAAVGFLVRQRRSPQPFLPSFLLADRTLRGLTALQLATGVGMAASTVYVTLDLQLLRGFSPVEAGLQTIPLAAGVLAGAAVGVLLQRRGGSLRPSFVFAGAVCALALGVLAAGVEVGPVLVMQGALGLLGIGVGLSLGNELLVIQALVPRRRLGIATSGVRFVETLGTSVGAALFAGLFGLLVGRPGVAGDGLHASLTLIFALGGLTMAGATWVALRLPADLSTAAARPPRGGLQPGHTDEEEAMNRYVVLYKAPQGVRERLAEASPEEAMEGVQQWVEWAQRVGPALVDPGRPLGRAVTLTASERAGTASDVVGMSILEAESMDDALGLVGDHHHLRWAEDCEILVLEETQIPELEAPAG
jgi:MFS family permease